MSDQTINFLFGVGVVVSVIMILLATFGPQKHKESHYQAPEVISALWVRRDGVLRMEVGASNIAYIDSRQLPMGTNISAIERNRLYLVEAPILPAGNAMSDRDVYEQAVEIARLNGFEGKVAKR